MLASRSDHHPSTTTTLLLRRVLHRKLQKERGEGATLRGWVRQSKIKNDVADNTGALQSGIVPPKLAWSFTFDERFVLQTRRTKLSLSPISCCCCCCCAKKRSQHHRNEHCFAEAAELAGLSKEGILPRTSIDTSRQRRK
jgi:hypothetical protein